MRLVRTEPLPALDIARHFPISQQAVSQHLSVLKLAGLLSEERDGNRRLYVVRVDGLGPLRGFLGEFWSGSLADLKHAVERDVAAAQVPSSSRGKPRAG